MTNNDNMRSEEQKAHSLSKRTGTSDYIQILYDYAGGNANIPTEVFAGSEKITFDDSSGSY